MNQIKFGKDFKKLSHNQFTTIRRGINWIPGEIYEVITPTEVFKARLRYAIAYKLKILDEDFIVLDTETKSIEEAMELLNSYYDPPLGKDERVSVLLFYREDD